MTASLFCYDATCRYRSLYCCLASGKYDSMVRADIHLVTINKNNIRECMKKSNQHSRTTVCQVYQEYEIYNYQEIHKTRNNYFSVYLDVVFFTRFHSCVHPFIPWPYCYWFDVAQMKTFLSCSLSTALKSTDWTWNTAASCLRSSPVLRECSICQALISNKQKLPRCPSL